MVLVYPGEILWREAILPAEIRSPHSTTSSMKISLLLQAFLLPSCPAHLPFSVIPKPRVICTTMQLDHAALVPLQNSIYQCCPYKKMGVCAKNSLSSQNYKCILMSLYPSSNQGYFHNLTATISQLLQFIWWPQQLTFWCNTWKKFKPSQRRHHFEVEEILVDIATTGWDLHPLKRVNWDWVYGYCLLNRTFSLITY